MHASGLRANTALLAALLSLTLGSGDAAAQSLGRPRLVKQISEDTLVGPPGSQDDTQTEPHVAVDPNDPDVIVAAFQEGRFLTGGAAVAIGYATSHDGGSTWTAGELPGLTVAVGGPFERASDPVVAIGPGGAVYAQTLGVDGTLDAHTRSSIVVQRSDDGGLGFGPPMLVQDDQAAEPLAVVNDKNWIAVDGFPSSPYYGRVYSAWSRLTAIEGGGNFGQVVLRHSDDGGETWSDLVPVSIDLFMIGAQPVVQPNGDLTIVYSAFPCAQVAQTSHDGGEHFDAPVAIAFCTGRTEMAELRTGLTQWLANPAAAVDPVSGLLYVAWEDSELRADGLHSIQLSSSSDGGASWTPPRTVGGSSRVHRFTPAVAAHDGAVVVSFRSLAPGRDRVGLRYVASDDGGASFGRERKIGRPGKLRFAAKAGERSFLGDYMGLAMSADAVHAVWCNASRPQSGAGPHQTTWSAVIARRTAP